MRLMMLQKPGHSVPIRIDRTRTLTRPINVCRYFASVGFSWGSTLENWPTIRQWASAEGKLFVASVGPGYCDEGIRPWNAHNTKPRGDKKCSSNHRTGILSCHLLRAVPAGFAQFDKHNDNISFACVFR